MDATGGEELGEPRCARRRRGRPVGSGTAASRGAQVRAVLGAGAAPGYGPAGTAPVCGQPAVTLGHL